MCFVVDFFDALALFDAVAAGAGCVATAEVRAAAVAEVVSAGVVDAPCAHAVAAKAVAARAIRILFIVGNIPGNCGKSTPKSRAAPLTPPMASALTADGRPAAP